MPATALRSDWCGCHPSAERPDRSGRRSTSRRADRDRVDRVVTRELFTHQAWRPSRGTLCAASSRCSFAREASVRRVDCSASSEGAATLSQRAMLARSKRDLALPTRRSEL